MDNRTRIIGVVLMVLLYAVNASAEAFGLDPKLVILMHEIVAYALPLFGFGALVDVLNTERRRRNPDQTALPDDVVRDGGVEAETRR